jgi:hypothetical protein
MLYFARMDLTPDSVVAYYSGSEDEFRPPKSYQSMLEVTHSHLPMMALILLLLTHLVIFAPLTRRGKILFVVVPFCAGLLSEASGWLVRFVDPGFAILKVVSFLTLQGGLVLLLSVLALFLVSSGLLPSSAPPNGRPGAEQTIGKRKRKKEEISTT